MRVWVTLVCALVAARPLEAANADLKFENGLYQGIVLGIDSATPEPESAATFLEEIKEFLEAGSAALHAALDRKAAFGDVKLVLPRTWDKTKFVTVLPAVQELTSANADILLHDTADSLPSTLQAEQCGVPGRQMKIPLSFLSLTSDEQNTYGTIGRILAHEWAHYRYGVHDEHGYTNDLVYTPAYGGNDTVTACTVGPLEGTWRTSCVGTSSSCRPNFAGCYYCITNQTTASIVQASLGFMPALSTGQFCNSLTHKRDSPSPQNRLCGGRSVMEVIQAHPDYQNMNPNVTVGSINIDVYEEPLGRVMLLLDTPPETGEVLSYVELLSNFEGPLTKYSHLPVSVVSFKSLQSDAVQLANLRPFARIEGTFSSLNSLLPLSESRVLVPDLALVLTEMLKLEDFAVEYSLGTLLVMPVTNALMAASNLDMELGKTLRSHHIKPLLLFPEVSPALAGAGSFLQHSGARFIARNHTAGPLGYASLAASAEIYAFVDNTFQRDHAIVTVDVRVLQGAELYLSQFWYQENIAQHMMAILTTSGDINQLKLKYYQFGSYVDCRTLNLCTVTDDAIFYLISHTQAANFLAAGWHLQVENTGNDNVEVTLTRSIVNFVRETEQELSVDVWSSDGRGPVAAISENNRFVLYASVSNRGKQVLGSNINVFVDVDVQKPGAALEHILGQPLLDNGALADLRKDDSVFSGYLSTDPFESGTIVTVKNVKVASHTITGELSPSPVRHHKRHAPAAASARLFSRNPVEEECCGSFVQDPNIEVQHHAKGFFLQVPDPIKPIEVIRTLTEIQTTTTAAPPASTAPSAAPLTNTTTTAAPLASTTPSAAPLTNTTTTAGPLASTTPSAAPLTNTTTTAAPLASTTTSATTEASPTVSTTTLPRTTTAGGSSLETSVTVLLQTAAALYLATLLKRL